MPPPNRPCLRLDESPAQNAGLHQDPPLRDAGSPSLGSLLSPCKAGGIAPSQCCCGDSPSGEPTCKAL